MVQRGEDSGFTLEAGQAFRIIGEEIRQDFQRHIPAELGIVGTVHLAHAAFADQGGDFIGTQAGPGRQGHELLSLTVGWTREAYEETPPPVPSWTSRGRSSRSGPTR